VTIDSRMESESD